MKITKVIHIGNVRYRVNEAQGPDGKRLRKFFETKEAAENYVKARTADARAFGVHFAPLLFGAAIGLGLIWLFSDKEETAQIAESEKPTLQLPPPIDIPAVEIPAEENLPVETETSAPVAPAFTQSNQRIAREDLAEALEYGARMFTHKEAVNALQDLGFRKTAAYKALSANSKFGSLLEFTPDGLIEWKG